MHFENTLLQKLSTHFLFDREFPLKLKNAVVEMKVHFLGLFKEEVGRKTVS